MKPLVMHRLLGLSVVAGLATLPRLAEANSCNLYTAQRFGEIRTGCPVTVVALPEVDPAIPVITRAGQPVDPEIVTDQLTLLVTFERYTTPDSCDLVESYENRTFDRHVVTWPSLQAGDEIVVDGLAMTVPGPGDCGVVQPGFYCADGIRSCEDPDPDPDIDPDTDDEGGCSAGAGSSSWLATFAVGALLGGRRRSRRRRG